MLLCIFGETDAILWTSSAKNKEKRKNDQQWHFRGAPDIRHPAAQGTPAVGSFSPLGNGGGNLQIGVMDKPLTREAEKGGIGMNFRTTK